MTDKITQLRDLLSKATPLPLGIKRYNGGGGRLFSPDRHGLVADFYEESDRELFLAMRNALHALLDVVEAAKHEREITLRPYADGDEIITAIERFDKALANLEQIK